MTQLLLRRCSTCGAERAFAAPECGDGHGPDCPDLACIDCGEAIFVGSLTVQLGVLCVPVAPAA